MIDDNDDDGDNDDDANQALQATLTSLMDLTYQWMDKDN